MKEKYKITLEEAMCFKNYYRALRSCNKMVNFKFSIQHYNANCIENIKNTIDYIRAGNIPAVKKTKKVLIIERGKQRVITPIDIFDRITQKVLCANVLEPSIYPHLIYDNGASVKHKGVGFARNRLNSFIEKAKREYGWNNV